MKNDSTEFEGWFSSLENVLRTGARRLMQSILEEEANEYVRRFEALVDDKQRRIVKRNGYSPQRSIVTGIGPIDVKKPRVLDRRQDHSFTSQILPPYLRKVPSVENLIPALYLKGLSTMDFGKALESILGPEYKGFSPKSVERLKAKWMEEYDEWRRRELTGKNYVYVWADGIYFNVRLEDAENKRMCFLVLMGALEDGTKELIGVLDGYRESKASWQSLLSDLSERGLSKQPKLAVGDGSLGFWAAIEEVWPETAHQRCWVHKTANILDKMPKSVQGRAKQQIHDMYLAETREEAFKAYDQFQMLYQDKFPKAFQCLEKDKDVLFSFYDFPAVHWQHIRTTNPIESTFATVRHRTNKTKGCGSRKATLMMVFKLCREASLRWRKLQGYSRILELVEGVRFIDGLTADEWEQRKAA
jgi:transposase-like protein